MTLKGGSPETPLVTREAILRAYYDDKRGATGIAREHGVDKRTVYNILVKFGKGTRPRSNRTGDDYVVPKGILEGVTPTGRPTGGQRGVRLPVNEKAFDVLTPDSSYWIGFLMADGCVSRESAGKSRRLMLRLSVKDRPHLELFKRWLGSEHAITEKDHIDPAGNPQRTCVLQIASEPLCTDLARWGIVERKTVTAKCVDALLFDRDFWRGCVDGDGCVYEDRQRVYLSGSKALVEQWNEWGRSITGETPDMRYHLSFVGKVGCWVGTFYGDAAATLLHLLYQPGDMWLPRKAAYVRTGA